ncbi:ligase-associated DNA damage response endonuclease PdeM [Flavobacteriaceae bacterium 3-367]|uniref:ligase-associated DNA damage response endonuclease PdeM n=1 Tax=Eudoraea algarum TaxID=3417568 RepID=UPI00327F5F75
MCTQNIQIQDQSFVLHPMGVLFWEQQSLLLISDVHLGKISHFRKYGAAVPQVALLKNYTALDAAVAFFNPKTICFMGDLFHSAMNSEWKLFQEWTAQVRGKIILVSGNHDIISPLKYEEMGIEVVDQLILNGFLLTHHPQDGGDLFNISGHIHPAVRLRGSGRQSVKLPCFFRSPQQLILPAFGEFTGNHVLKPNKRDTVYAITENEVILVAN